MEYKRYSALDDQEALERIERTWHNRLQQSERSVTTWNKVSCRNYVSDDMIIP
jgi:hypothetical protein